MDAIRSTSTSRKKPAGRDPEQTRRRLVDTAARVFNEVGYHGTDSNALARAAGYSPGAFYRHFASKKEIFLAVHAAWVAREWEVIGELIARGGPPAQLSERLAHATLAHHRRWARFRSSLRALIAEDEEVARHFRAQRRAQLDSLAALRRRYGAPPQPARDLLLLLWLERTWDAIADGEVSALGVSVSAVAREMGAWQAGYITSVMQPTRSGKRRR